MKLRPDHEETLLILGKARNKDFAEMKAQCVVSDCRLRVPFFQLYADELTRLTFMPSFIGLSVTYDNGRAWLELIFNSECDIQQSSM